MGNSRKASAPIKGQVREMKAMTPEQRQEQAAMAYLQKKENIATGVLMNLCHNANVTTNAEALALVDLSLEMADKFIEKLYFTKKD